MQITSNLYECKHCSGSGNCTNAKDSTSCLACAKRNELPFWRLRNQSGLLCGSCGGIGQAEPMTERMNKRIAPALAIVLTTGLLVMVGFAAILKSPHFSELLAFGGTIIGTVVGFYFSNKRESS